MTYRETMDYIESLKATGICLGLERMTAAAEATGHPEHAFDAVHIAGTNGKGSTAAMIAAALHANGYTVGMYSSPVITTLLDTVTINQIPVTEEQFAEQASLIRGTVPFALSEFEFVTLTALACFQAQHVDIAVIECGMGGATDATNILPSPLCAVLTPIDLDHGAFLGNTIEEIAAQKSGIIKHGCHAVCSPNMDEDALGVIFEKAATVQAIVHLPTLSALQNVAYKDRCVRFSVDNQAFSLSMSGRHQLGNAATALETLAVLKANGYHLHPDKIARALREVQLPCRQEWITPTLLLDGAHNPHGITALTNTIKHLEQPPVVVLGMLKDKDVEHCVAQMAPLAQHIICCTPENPRALTADELGAVARRYTPVVTVVDDPIEAYQTAKKIAANNTIVVSGSFYTAGHIRKHIIRQ